MYISRTNNITCGFAELLHTYGVTPHDQKLLATLFISWSNLSHRRETFCIMLIRMSQTSTKSYYREIEIV